MNTGKWGAEGQGLGQLMPSTGSSISLCDDVCSYLISCTGTTTLSLFPWLRALQWQPGPFPNTASIGAQL